MQLAIGLARSTCGSWPVWSSAWWQLPLWRSAELIRSPWWSPSLPSSSSRRRVVAWSRGRTTSPGRSAPLSSRCGSGRAAVISNPSGLRAPDDLVGGHMTSVCAQAAQCRVGRVLGGVSCWRGVATSAATVPMCRGLRRPGHLAPRHFGPPGARERRGWEIDVYSGQDFVVHYPDRYSAFVVGATFETHEFSGVLSVTELARRWTSLGSHLTHCQTT